MAFFRVTWSTYFKSPPMDSRGDAGHVHGQGLQPPGDVRRRRLALDAGASGQNDLADLAGRHPGKQLADADVVRPHSAQGRQHTRQNVIVPVECAGLLDGHHVPRLLHHAHHRGVAGRVAADGAQLMVAEGKTARAEPDLLFDLQNAARQFLHGLVRRVQQVQGQALGGLFPDSRQTRHVMDQITNGRWIVAHDETDPMTRTWLPTIRSAPVC